MATENENSSLKYDYFKKLIENVNTESIIFLLFFLFGGSVMGYVIYTGFKYQEYTQRVKNYQDTLNVVIQCRERFYKDFPEKIESFCGKVPEWSQFQK